MRDRLKVILLSFFLLAGSSFLQEVQAQDQVITNIRDAMKAGSSRELARHFSDMVDLNIKTRLYSFSDDDITKDKTPFVLKQFFDKYPNADYSTVHQGSSEDGISFTIGRYSYDSGKARVWIVLKKTGNEYKVTKFSLEEE
ncbi:DUF4783 domain-containing protein [Nafulsella turpanensis]|uniref:DUF4783 domain-containing protein n=1 Tax=Nafulsella turpanensis TaxID=1265690 RepID=UPI0009D98F67|nr:DUF4783 domain-containing protein [Nafulsella turpanensis]